MKLHVFFLLVAVSLGAALQAQIFPPLGGQRAGISALTFLKMDLNPRSAALGGANLCLSGDAFSAFSNPASLAENEGLTVGAANTFWTAGINASAFSIGTRGKAGNFALSLGGLSSGAMEVRTEFQPNGTGELFYASYFSAGLTYSKQLTDYFRYGVTLKYVREQLGDFFANTAALDLGFLYRTDFKDLSFAVAVQNFGLNSVLQGDLPGENTFSGQSRNIEDYPAPTIFQLGVSIIPWKSADEKQNITTSVQLNHPNDNAENLRIGAEYSWREILFLRAGYKLNVIDQDLPTAGIGLRSRIGRNPLRIDYAFDPTDFQGVYHRIGLAFSVNKEKR